MRHLAHELRQPLSSIENIAYYLDMVLERSEPELHAQIGQLRRFIDQASWIIEDAARFVRPLEAQPRCCRVEAVLDKVAAGLALHDERALDLHIAAALPDIQADPWLLEQALRGIAGLLHASGQSAPLRIAVRHAGACLEIEIDAQLGAADTHAVARMLDPVTDSPALQIGSIRRLVEAQHGRLSVTPDEAGRLAVVVALQTRASLAAGA